MLHHNNEKVLEQTLNYISDFYKKKLIYLEIRNNFDFNSYKDVFQFHKFLYQPHFNIQLDTFETSMEAILANMKYNRRREIKISYKEGAVVNEANDEKEIILLYEILKELYQSRVKLPIPNLDFFIALFKSKIGKVFIVKHDDKIIGGSFCFYYENDSIYTFYYAGLTNYNKKIFPTHIAIMGVIKFAIKNNLKFVDFMGAGTPGVDYGVREFKSKFGGDLKEYGRFIRINKPKLYNIGKLGLKILQKIK